MKYSTNALVAGAALAAGTANSLMISPNMLDAASVDERTKSEFGLNIAQVLDPETTSRLVKVNCPGCEFPVKGEDGVMTQKEENDLVFDFKTTTDRKTLLLNGKQFYPLSLPMIKAGQSAADVSYDDLRTDFDAHVTTPRPLDFALKANEIEAADGADAKLIDLEFQPLGIEAHPITVDGLSIRLLSDEEGVLSIVDIITSHNGNNAHEVEAEPSKEEESMFKILPISIDETPRPHHPRPHHTKVQHTCEGPTAFFCRWAQLVEDKVISAFKVRPHGGHRGPKRPCPGMMRGHGMGKPPHVPIKGGIPKFMPKFMPWKYLPETLNKAEPVEGHDAPIAHPHPHHHHSHHADLFHGISMAIKRIFFGFVIPVMIGVAAGMTASLIGMLVGTLIAWTWIKLVRGGRRGYEQVEQITEEEYEDDIKDEKHALLPADAKDVEEPLPVYSERQE